MSFRPNGRRAAGPDQYDLVVVGMGSGGMTAAEFAAELGLRVAVVERSRVGGDCLWTGCVPSKALLASAKAAHTVRHAADYGLSAELAPVDTTAVWTRLRTIQTEIANTDDDPDRYRAMGIEIVAGTARIVGPHAVEVDGDRRLHTRFILVCTGSRPAIPSIPGIDGISCLTSETVFELERAPSSVVFIGGGPIAIEMAQALRRLGVVVTVLQKGDRILPRDEVGLVTRLTRVLRDEGVVVETDVDVRGVDRDAHEVVVRGAQSGGDRTWRAEALFVAAGRQPNVDGLGLEALGIAVGPRGVVVDDRLRSLVPSIYAAGDVAGRYLFTHSAGYEAVRAVRDMFFPGKGRADAAVPWCTFTDPELAHAGCTENEAVERFGSRAVRVWRRELEHSDRARTDGATAGEIVIVTARGKIVGAQILAPAAGEMIHELALAIREGCSLTSLGSLVHVYPTLSTTVQQIGADAAYAGAKRFAWLARRGRK